MAWPARTLIIPSGHPWFSQLSSTPRRRVRYSETCTCGHFQCRLQWCDVTLGPVTWRALEGDVTLEAGGAKGKAGSVLPGRRDEAGDGVSSRSGGPLRRHTFPHVRTRSCHPTRRTVHVPGARARDSSAGRDSSSTQPWLPCRGCGAMGLAHRRDGRRRPDSRAGRSHRTAIPTDLQLALASGTWCSRATPFDGLIKCCSAGS